MMRLKTLIVCLFGLNLTACSTFNTHTQLTSETGLDQKASNAINAIYAYPSYDFNGRFKMSIDAESNAGTAKTAAKLDQELEKQVEGYRKTQNIQLTQQQKQDFYRVITKGSGSKLRDAQVPQIFSGLLEPMQFSYDGSVHYRQKLAALNLRYKYETPNVKSEVTAPMLVDFQNNKFYFNIAGFIPYLVSKENRDRFVYFDFSKYSAPINNVDFKNLVRYITQSSAVPYLLADGQTLQSLALNPQDQANGVVEKVRLKSSIEEMIVQQFLYATVNQNYLKTAILKTNQAEEISDLEDEDELYFQSIEERLSYRASDELNLLVESILYPVNESAESAVDDDNIAEESTQSISASSSDEDDQIDVENGGIEGMNHAQCRALAQVPAELTMGDINYCKTEYYIDVLDATQGDQQKSDENLVLATMTSLDALAEVFKADMSETFVDAPAFKTLWVKHMDEINAALAKQDRNPMTVDIGLDAEGRARTIDYAVDLKVKDFGTFHFNTEMNIINYGQATAIPKSILNNAMTLQEMFKGSALEGLAKILDQRKAKGEAAEVPHKTLDEQLEEVAQQVYAKTHSYSKTYQAVFIMQLSADQPKVVQHYTAQQLNEIARVYAFSFADDGIYNPQGKARAELERLQVKHHLNDRSQYDYSLGNAVYRVVEDAIK